MVEKLTGFKLEDLKQLMKTFQQHAKPTDGSCGVAVIHYSDFCRVLGYQEDDRHARNLFSFLDYDECGHLEFLEVVGGLALLSRDTSFDRVDRVALAFWIYDQNGNGRVESSEIVLVHQRNESVMPADLEARLQRLQDADGGFTFESFLRLVQQCPALLDAPLEAARKRLSSVVAEAQLRNRSDEKEH